MDSQLRKVFGFALLFTLVFGTVSAERAVAQLDPEDCPSGDTITVETTTFKTVGAADAAARADSASERERTMQELFDCAIANYGSTVQFADGAYDDFGEIIIGNATDNDGDDPDTTDVTEKVTFQGNSANREAVKFTGEVNFRVQASNLLIQHITFENTENIEMHDWPNVTDTFVVEQFNLDADKCRENVEIRNCVFRNTRKDGVSYHTGHRNKSDCNPSGFTVADSLFENIGYNNEWEDGYGPGDLGSGIPKIIHATVEGASEINSGTVPDHVNQSQNVGIRVHGSGLIKKVAITGNTIDGTTHSGMLVHGVTGAAGEKIEILNNIVNNVPRSGIVVRELPATTAATYDLDIKNNLVVNSGNSPWLVADYTWYADGLRSGGRYYGARSFMVTRRLEDYDVDSLLKPEIWSITENTVKDGTKIFVSDEPPVNIYDNFGGNDEPATDGRSREYDGDFFRKVGGSSQIPASEIVAGSFAFTPSRAGSCIGDDSNTGNVREDHFACFSVVRFLDPYAAGAIQLNGVSTTGTVEIMENEIRDNTLGLVLCGGGECYFNSPYSAVAYANNNAAYAKPEISMNNIYGESRISEGDRAEVPAEFAMGAVYASIGDLTDKVDLNDNYLGAEPMLFTDTNSESLSEVSEYTLETARLDIEFPELPQPRPPVRRPTGPVQPTPLALTSAAVDGNTLTLTYNKTLDGGSVPATRDFTVMVGGEERDISMVSVSGATVTLTLASAVETGDVVTISYTPGDNPIRDASGENASALTTDRTVSNNTSRPGPPGGGGGSSGGGGGCALASGGSGVGLGMLLALMAVPFGVAAGGRAREVR